MDGKKDYHKDLKPEDFPSYDAYLEQRVRRGLAAGYTFKQCQKHWYEDFGKALGLDQTVLDQILKD